MNLTDKVERFRADLLAWADDNLRSFPWRETADPYAILVAEILLQKTSAETVEPIFIELMATYPTPADMAKAESADVGDLIYTLGLQNKRSKALVALAEQIQANGVPDNDEDLLELPYVGRYAANATLCFAFGKRRPIVDANVVRVYNRIFAKEFDYRDEAAWSFATVVLPVNEPQRFNLALLDFAAQVCTPKVPNCEDCFFTDSCHYYHKLNK